MTQPPVTALPQFAVFFSVGAGFAIEMVQAPMLSMRRT